MSDDELRARLRAADPAAGTDAPDLWVDEMAEATMTDGQLTERRPAPEALDRPARRARWLLAAAAAALVAVAAVGLSLDRAGDGSAPPAAQPSQVMTLSLPANDPMAMCLAFSVDVLRPMEVAFSGTATAVGARSVTLRPDHWYKGGDGSDLVRLATLGDTVALEGGIAFEEGKRYLITATGGTVNACGFSAEWSPEMAAAYTEAFER
ncbi:hypothetical protein [Intrasporangium sp. DVR]|uniref:hypothetical protein n=1 Tax=Intrasporangium sp. DVR TaxID=3127867 RepID=UPI00313A7013